LYIVTVHDCDVCIAVKTLETFRRFATPDRQTYRESSPALSVANNAWIYGGLEVIYIRLL